MCQLLKELCPQIKAHGGFKGAAKFLRMSASQLEYEALREFESFKTSFGSTSRPVRFEIYGGSPDENRQIPIRIDRCVSKAYMKWLKLITHSNRATMTGFFGACVDRIIQMVNGQEQPIQFARALNNYAVYHCNWWVRNESVPARTLKNGVPSHPTSPS